MEIKLADLIKEFRKYSTDHPLRLISDKYFDINGNFNIHELATNSWAINTMTAIGRPLLFLANHNEKAYKDMVKPKIKAKNKDSYNLHGLISAFCELSVMNTFICRSTNPESFKYEDQLVSGSTKNVEFSIIMDTFLFHVEVKTSDLILEDQSIAELLKKNPEVLVVDARIDYYEEFVQKSSIPIRGSLDRRLADFLDSAEQKFSRTESEYEINLLIICWDDRIQQPLMALKSSKAHGLLTSDSFYKDEDNNPKQYPNINCILVNSNYALFKEYVSKNLFKNFSLYYPVDPFFQLFTNNFLINYNLTTDRKNIIPSIIQQKVQIVDELYADNLNPISIATMKEGEKDTIKFRPKT